ncbi:CRISPR-associated endoribonuclease Cas6 [Thermococcus thioreducens]|uniref:CRISPR-associated endoribonuclease n=1 Tax=Thermococcus thioreducens TaxID=277988 RepID=A0A1I0P598_9EURY|nr:CRISPR-associated endoribonuclease Cas6 [Thermococcus thioreducens]SEW09436.1 CRISPR-associated endoribonuclease Cas6 [Thermococcus thioreducens]
MRLELLLHFEEPFLIPYNYPRPLYSLIVHAIELGDPLIAKRIHNNRRDIKFVASRLLPLGKTKASKNGLLVESGRVKLFVGSAAWPVLEALVNGLATGAGRLSLGRRKLLWAEARPKKAPARFSGKRFRTLSPVNVYHNSPPNGFRSWDLSPVGQPNSPFDDEPTVWRELVFENLKSKYLMVYGEPYDGDFDIEVFPKSVRSKMFRIKRDDKTGKYTKVRAWHFEFRMRGDEELLRVVWTWGLE